VSHLEGISNQHNKFEYSRSNNLEFIDPKHLFYLKVWVTLIFGLKNYAGHLIVMIKHHSKFENTRTNGLAVIEQYD